MAIIEFVRDGSDTLYSYYYVTHYKNACFTASNIKGYTFDITLRKSNAM